MAYGYSHGSSHGKMKYGNSPKMPAKQQKAAEGDKVNGRPQGLRQTYKQTGKIK